MVFDSTSFEALVSRGRNFRESPYHYILNEGVAITFIVLFGLSSLIHAGQAIHYRMWWLIPTACLCGLLEVIGWSARLWSSFSPLLSTPFEMQITATILGPTPLLAANFVIFGTIIHRLGPQFSRLSPKWYTILFCTCDVISLVVQGVGGGKAAAAVGAGRDPRPGANIMLGGICFQLIVITIYAIFSVEFYFRYHLNRPIRQVNQATSQSQEPGLSLQKGAFTKKIRLMSMTLLLTTTCLFIRAIYRTIELSDGWNGRIIGTQVYFNVLDGAMVTIAFYTLNIAHPGLLLGSGASLSEATSSAIEKEKERQSGF